MTAGRASDRHVTGLVAVVVGLVIHASVLVAPALAQGTPGRIGVRGFVFGDDELMSASKTFQAITGSDTTLSIGGGADIVIRTRPFVRVSVERSSANGMRGVFGSDGTFNSNGISEKITMMPIELGGGWRFVSAPRKAPRTPPGPRGPQVSSSRGTPGRPHTFVPYLGGAVVLVRYTEFAAVLDTENTATTFHGLAAFGGLDIALGSAITFGVEGEYRTLPNTIGLATSSLAADLQETNLGGVSVRLLFGIRFGRF